MAPQVPVGEPSALRAGTTWSWKRPEFSDYPVADNWTYTYYLTGKTSTSFAATNGTNEFSVSVPATTTDDVAAGVYAWELRASLDGAVYSVDFGSFEVVADVAVTAASDQRTHAEKMLALVEAELEARITGDGSAHDSYGIGTSAAGARQMQKVPLEKLKAMRATYAAEVQRQKHGGRLPPYKAVATRP